MTQEKDQEAFKRLGGAAGIAQALGTDLKEGLSDAGVDSSKQGPWGMCSMWQCLDTFVVAGANPGTHLMSMCVGYVLHCPNLPSYGHAWPFVHYRVNAESPARIHPDSLRRQQLSRYVEELGQTVCYFQRTERH